MGTHDRPPFLQISRIHPRTSTGRGGQAPELGFGSWQRGFPWPLAMPRLKALFRAMEVAAQVMKT